MQTHSTASKSEWPHAALLALHSGIRPRASSACMLAAALLRHETTLLRCMQLMQLSVHKYTTTHRAVAAVAEMRPEHRQALLQVGLSSIRPA